MTQPRQRQETKNRNKTPWTAVPDAQRYRNPIMQEVLSQLNGTRNCIVYLNRDFFPPLLNPWDKQE